VGLFYWRIKMSIIALEDYKAYAGITNPNSDTKLQYIVDSVNDYITEYCNTNFSPVVKTDIRTLHNNTTIILPDAPTISVEALNIVELDGTKTLVEATSYIVDLEGGVIDIVDPTITIPTRKFAFSADYTCGHAAAPNALVLSALELL
jgi:hypothetical protein